MTRKEIMLNTKWDEFEMGTCGIFIPFFDQYIPFIFFQEHTPTPDISTKMIASINMIIGFDTSVRNTYLEAFKDEDGNYLDHKVKEIHIDQDNDRLDGLYAEIIIQLPTSNTVNLIVKDGKIVCIDHDNSYFEKLAEKEQ
jgi:hypothetical protein